MRYSSGIFWNWFVLLVIQAQTYSLLQAQLLFSSFLVILSVHVPSEGHECDPNGNASHQFGAGIPTT